MKKFQKLIEKQIKVPEGILKYSQWFDDYGFKRDLYTWMITNPDGSQLNLPMIVPIKARKYTKNSILNDYTHEPTKQEMTTFIQTECLYPGLVKINHLISNP